MNLLEILINPCLFIQSLEWLLAHVEWSTDLKNWHSFGSFVAEEPKAFFRVIEK